MMKIVAKMLVLSLVLGPVAFLGGCQKRCGERCEPVMKDRCDRMERERCGEK